MIPSFTGMETALSGLQAYQAAIDTTGQNISNANTPGYSRQVVNLTESDPLDIPAMSNVNGTGGQLGTGVDVSSISRIRDQFLDTQYRAQNAMSGAATQVSTDLTSAQSALNEPSSDGIASQLSTFFGDWTAVANNPTSTAALQTLVGDAKTLAGTFKSVSGQLTTIQAQAAVQLTSLTDTTAGSLGPVQTAANQISTLNGEIAQQTASGQTPNDLLDQRDQLLDTLSGYASVSTGNAGNGMLNVTFGGASLVTASGVTSAASTSWPATLTSASGGQLGALISESTSTGPIGTLQTSLNTVAGQLVSTVNKFQSPTSPFFSATTGSEASTIAVVATTSTLQTSSSTTSGTDLASSIAALESGTDQSYAGFVAQVGSAVQSAQGTSTDASSLLNSINSQRESVSGVSLDEEMTNLMNYQQGYQASARVMTTIDSLLNTLINQTGAGL